MYIKNANGNTQLQIVVAKLKHGIAFKMQS